MRSRVLFSASENSMISIPSPVYQCKNAFLLNIAANFRNRIKFRVITGGSLPELTPDRVRWNNSWIAVELDKAVAAWDAMKHVLSSGVDSEGNKPESGLREALLPERRKHYQESIWKERYRFARPRREINWLYKKWRILCLKVMDSNLYANRLYPRQERWSCQKRSD